MEQWTRSAKGPQLIYSIGISVIYSPVHFDHHKHWGSISATGPG